jgi:hypothetical protein
MKKNMEQQTSEFVKKKKNYTSVYHSRHGVKDKSIWRAGDVKIK